MDYPMLKGLDPFDIMDVESERLYRFFSSLDDDAWTKDTRCEGWRRREIVAHLASADTYHNACLDDTLEDLFKTFQEMGAKRSPDKAGHASPGVPLYSVAATRGGAVR